MILHRIANDSISLGKIGNSANAQLDFNILDANDAMRPFHLRAVGKRIWLVCWVGWLLAIIGSYFRYILYAFIFKKYKTRQLTPIDVLIFVSASIQHVTNLARMIFYTAMISEGLKSDHWDWQMDETGFLLCSFLRLCLVFELYHSCVGSLGISIYRILYIKHNDFIKYKIGEWNLLLLVLIGGILFTASMTVSTSMNDYEKLLTENCHIPANPNILLVLDEYKIAGGYPSPYIRFIYPRIINGMVMVGMTVAEIGIYVAFFHSAYQHDNSKWLEKILDKKCIQRRNKTNAITFFGQFCSFLFEMTYWILLLLAFVVGRKEGFLWASASFLRFISFSVMAAIDVLVSNSLRPKVFVSLRKLIERGLKV